MSEITDLAQAATVAKLVEDHIKGIGAVARQALAPAMTTAGASQTVVTAADGVKMATVSLVGGTAKASVTNPGALLAHVLEHYPTEIVQEVRESFLKVLLARADEIGEPIDLDGRVIPGIEFVPKSQYPQVRPSKAARERIAAVLESAGWMQQLPGAFTVPANPPGEDPVERDTPG